MVLVTRLQHRRLRAAVLQPRCAGGAVHPRGAQQADGEPAAAPHRLRRLRGPRARAAPRAQARHHRALRRGHLLRGRADRRGRVRARARRRVGQRAAAGARHRAQDTVASQRLGVVHPQPGEY